jgi:hypothetical protein
VENGLLEEMVATSWHLRRAKGTQQCSSKPVGQ